MTKFLWKDNEKYIDEIPFLKDNYEIISSITDLGKPVYKIKNETENTKLKLTTLQECGMIEIIREIDEFDSFEDIIPLTQKVEKLKSSPLFLKIFFPKAVFLLSESELLSSNAFRRCLLREGKFIGIPTKAWNVIVQYWLDISIEIFEETEEDQLTDKVLNYLSNCVIYDDISKSITRNTLYYDNTENNCVYCLIESIIDFLNNKRKNEVSSRKLRVILSDYIIGNSIQKRIYDNRYRFWKFDIIKSGIKLEKQKYEEEKEGNDIPKFTIEKIDIGDDVNA